MCVSVPCSLQREREICSPVWEGFLSVNITRSPYLLCSLNGLCARAMAKASLQYRESVYC